MAGCFSKWDIIGCGCGCKLRLHLAGEDLTLTWQYNPAGETSSGTAAITSMGVVGGLQTWQSGCIVTGLSGLHILQCFKVQFTYKPATEQTILTVTGYPTGTTCTGTTSIYSYDSCAPDANQLAFVSCTSSPPHFHFNDRITPTFWDLVFTL